MRSALVRQRRPGRRDELRALLALLQALVQVRFRPRGDLVRRVESEPGGPVGARPVPAAPPAEPISPSTHRRPLSAHRRAEEVAIVLDRVARRLPRSPRCLVRSIALVRLLDGHGIPGSRMRFGVRKRGGRFEAHAWVELDGRVLGDSERRVRGFAPVPDLELRRPPR